MCGAPMALFLAGAQILENYPVGPLGGVAFNLTLLSYAGSLDMGVNIDTAVVTEPDLLRHSLQRAFATSSTPEFTARGAGAPA